ncbi:hypothetical protein FCH28_12965 [Streptomyces piniterrae]|uniref:Uncharacterized protein n=2 Tax=Streptomyces piniterrae TaxID=2571125 RepID=A0A4U0NK33_9ACTN|nr:hypothetical protein FCH28_12965 [Streptomyces piniterrae]
MAGVLVSVSVVALGPASAAPQGSGEPTKAAAQAAPAADSAREHWQPPTHRDGGPGDPGTEPGKINTDYLISEVSPAQFRGYWYQSHINGVSVTWVAPSGRDPYNTWDWIEILDSNGKRVTWDWACGNANCGAYGSTLIDAKLTKGAEYRALYYSDGGRVTKGTLQAEFEFWA